MSIKRKPWITNAIHELICTNNKMHRTHYGNGNAPMKLEYK